MDVRPTRKRGGLSGVRMRVRGLGVLLCVSFVLLCARSLSSQKNGSAPYAKAKPARAVEISLATATRLEVPKDSWWPTKTPQSRDGFVGNAACAGCHAHEVTTQAATPMAHAARTAVAAPILLGHAALTGHRGLFTYKVSRDESGSNLSASDGTTSLSHKILWAFGAGNKGQTYVYSNDGAYYESEMSFYSALGELDVTTGHESHQPSSLADALGIQLDPATEQKCFGCHTTSATTVSGGLAPEKATAGITCEACHGPGGARSELMDQLQGETPSGDLRIFNPHSLSPVASVDFCGACHRTWADVYELVYTAR